MIEKQQLTQPESFLSIALESWQDGIAIFDHHQRMLYCNPAFARHWGYKTGQFSNQTLADIASLTEACAPWQGSITIRSGSNQTITRHQIANWREALSNRRGSPGHNQLNFEAQFTDGHWRRISRTQLPQKTVMLQITLIDNVKELEGSLLKLSEQLKHSSTTDELTGLDNRRHFYRLANSEYDRSLRYHHSLSVLAITLDHLKRLNYQGGQEAGDLALQTLARCCRQQLRDSDLIGRTGGNEFLIMLPETHLPTASAVSQRLLEAMRQSPLKRRDQQIQLTISIGMASNLQMPCDLPQLLDFADQALYRAIISGRNQVCQYQPPAAEQPSHA